MGTREATAPATASVAGGARAPRGRVESPGGWVFADFHDAYVAHLRWVFEDAEFRNAPRGYESRECLSVRFRLTNPRERVPLIRARRTNIVFCFAEALWYLGARNDLDYLAYYAPSVRRYSADGSTLTGTAYGPRIFRYGSRGIDQWRQVLDVLAGDPDSKRAVVQIFDPAELLDADNGDVACTLALQLFVRESALHMAGFMRANDAYRGVVSDVFSFTLIQEVLATQLGLELGSYSHSVGSYHVYESDADRVEEVIAETSGPAFGRPDLPFPRMPRGDNRPAVATVLELEEGLRRNTRRLTVDEIRTADVHPYWQQVLALFELYRAVVHEGTMASEVVDFLDPLYRWLVAHKWPRLFRESGAREPIAAEAR